MTSNSIQNSIIADKYAKLGKGSSSNRLTNKYYDRVKIESLLADFEQVGPQGIEGPIGPQGLTGPPGVPGADPFVPVTTNPVNSSRLTPITTTPFIVKNSSNLTDIFIDTTGSRYGIQHTSVLPGPALASNFLPSSLGSPRTASLNSITLVEAEVEIDGTLTAVYIPAYFNSGT